MRLFVSSPFGGCLGGRVVVAVTWGGGAPRLTGALL